MRRIVAALAGVAIAVLFTVGTASAATRHHMLITGPAGASGRPGWVYDNNPNPKKSTLAIYGTVYDTAHDSLRPIKGTSLCLQRKSTHGGSWHKLFCRTSDRHGDYRFLIASAPHSGWYYRVHHYSSRYFYAATSWTCHPVY
jgi:hypothetical protein